MNIYDGSGLSPLNRITTHAQVEVLKLAKTRDWFPSFYDALPEYNGMKMKSGTINDVKGFCGYQSSKDGQDFIFSILVNNYSGSTSGLVNKIFKVLDELK
jgi:D-alanyl-D-alanine carboxypeptidase/D-alanyl-D-alanine-endopeptidase (penicillin-binding protein 4)